MVNIKETVRSNLKEAMKIRKIRQVDIANHLGLSAPAVSNWFIGNNFIDVENLYHVCVFLGISMNQVFGLESITDKPIDDNERDLLTLYRGSDEAGKKIAINALTECQKKDITQSAI